MWMRRRTEPRRPPVVTSAAPVRAIAEGGIPEGSEVFSFTLDVAGLSYTEHRRAGDPGSSIAGVAASEACDLIVMGTRGQGAGAAALLGSVAQSTVEQSTVPVLFVK